MKKVLFASVLAAGAMTAVTVSYSQAPATPAPTATDGGQVQMPAAEASAYNNAISQSDPKAKAAAIEAYLTQYPQSQVKGPILEQLLGAYSTFDPAKTLDTGDRLLQVDPNNIRGLAVETGILKSQADQQQDVAQKQTLLDKASGFAQRGLKATKPTAMSDTDFAAIQKQVTPFFYGVIGNAALLKKDSAGAVAAFESELKAAPEEQTKQPGPLLQDTFFLAQAYYQMTPPDYLKCTFFATRAVTFAPDQFKPTFQPLASYCYKKFHGADDGYDAVKTAASATLFPTDSFATSITPAPTPADTVKQVLASTPDLTKLNLGDREYIMLNGTPEQADSVFAPIKGKEVKVSGVVVSISGTSLQLAVSDDAKAGTPKVADFSVTLKTAPTTPPAPDATVDVVATFDSYTQKPLMITMTGGEIPAAAKKAPAARRPAARRK